MLRGRVASRWRYHEVMPVLATENIITLGEGWTPLLEANRLGKKLGLANLMLKKAIQATGSTKGDGQQKGAVLDGLDFVR